MTLVLWVSWEVQQSTWLTTATLPVSWICKKSNKAETLSWLNQWMSGKWANFTIAQALYLCHTLLVITNWDRLKWTSGQVARMILRECDKACLKTKEEILSQVWDQLLGLKIRFGIFVLYRRKSTSSKILSDTRQKPRWIEFTNSIWRKSISIWWMRKLVCRLSTESSNDCLKQSNRSSMPNSPAITKLLSKPQKVVWIKNNSGQLSMSWLQILCLMRRLISTRLSLKSTNRTKLALQVH